MKRILTILAVLLSLAAQAQNETPWNYNAINNAYDGLWPRGIFMLPRDTTKKVILDENYLPVGDSGILAYWHGKPWWKDNVGTWREFASDLSAYMKYSDSAGMLVPYLRKGDVPLFAIENRASGLQANSSFGITGTARIASLTTPAAPMQVGTLPSYLNKSAHFEGTIRIEKGVALDDAITLKQFRDSGVYVNPRWFGAVPDDGVSDRLAIQAAIDYAGGRLRVGVDGAGRYDIDSTLLVQTGTYLDAGEASIYLMDGSDCAMLSNRNKTTPSSMDIVDSSITIVGGHWFGNGDNQVKFMPDGTPVSGFLFAGVKYLTFSPRRIINTQTYAVFSTNVSHSQYSGLEIDQGVYNPPLHNQDGLHFNGPAHHIIVSRCVLKTFDDAIAFNTEDVPQGPWLTQGEITDILVSDIVFNETRKGIRLLSATSLMDRMIVNNLTGTATDNLLEVSAYGLGTGNFGDISISNVNVKMRNNIANNEYISFNNRIRSVYVDNVIRMPDNDIRNTIKVKPLANIDILELRNLKTLADTTYNYSDIVTQGGSNVRRMVVDNYRYVGGKPGKSTGIAINGTSVNVLEIRNSSFDSLATAVAISTSSIKQLRLSDNNAGRVYNAVFLNASPITDTLHLYGSVMVDTLNNAFSTAGAASIGRIKSYLPTVSAPGAQATFAPIRYSYSSVQYSLNPVATIDLQTVTSVSGATSNLMKSTGAGNLKNGAGAEMFYSAGTATFWGYDRGGTNTNTPTYFGGAPAMVGPRVLFGPSTTATDDGSTTAQVKGSFSLNQTSTSGNLTLTNAHHFVKITNSTHVITLPAASATPGRVYWILNSTASPATISSVQVWGSGTTAIPANTSWGIYSDGTNWVLFSRSN